jgi:hypothetical protein
MSTAEYRRQWKLNNKERERNNNARWYEENKLGVKLRKSKEYRKNPEREKTRTNEWKKSNATKISHAIKSNPSRRIAAAIRSKMSNVLAGRLKSNSTVKCLGCSFEDLKRHLESLFQSGMSWDNYGLHGWHIDHIKPLAAFDLTDEEQFKEAWHYTNLQPLWAVDNLRKGKSYNE